MLSFPCSDLAARETITFHREYGSAFDTSQGKFAILEKKRIHKPLPLGIMTEAMTAILTYAFTQTGLRRVEAVVDDVNERSKGLLLKLGFTHEGTLRQRFYFRDRFLDEHYFGLLKDEWSAL